MMGAALDVTPTLSPLRLHSSWQLGGTASLSSEAALAAVSLSLAVGEHVASGTVTARLCASCQ